MHDYEIEKPFPIDIGANLKFVAYRNEEKMYKAKTLLIPNRSVHWNISTYRDSCPGAVHWYGYLRVYSLSIEIIEAYGNEKKYNKPGNRFSTNFFTETIEKCPELKWAEGFSIDITYERDTDEENPYEKDPILLEKAGYHSTRFPIFYVLKDRMEEEIKRLFKPPWKINYKYSTEEGLQVLRKLKQEDI